MDDLHIVTVATESKYYFPYLVESCRRYGKELEILGFGQKWKGFNWRFKLMIEYLETLQSNDIVCVVDGYDVICTRNLNELKNMFLKVRNEKKCKIIVGYDNLDHCNYSNKFIVKMFFGSCNNISLNAGTYIGYVKDLLEIIQNMQSINDNESADDQVLLTKYCNLQTSLFYIDKQNEIFLTIPKPLHEIDDIVILNNNIFYNNKYPFFLHGPGGTYLDNVIKKLGYEYNVEINKLIKYKYNWIFIFWNEYHNLFIITILLLVLMIIYIIHKYYQKYDNIIKNGL